MALADGAFRQVEEFLISVHTRSGTVRLTVNYDELIALKDIVDKLAAISEEAKLWPFGEIEKRQGLLPVLRIHGSDAAGPEESSQPSLVAPS